MSQPIATSLSTPLVVSRPAGLVGAQAASPRPAVQLLPRWGHRTSCASRRLQVTRAEQSGSEPSSQQAPATPPPAAEDDEPVWVKREKARELAAKTGGDLPFGLYLLFSVIVAIAAVGSIFEYSAKNPIFGVLPPDNILWAPILLFFAVTGLPMSGYLLFRSVQAANKLAEEMDAMDGYR